MISSKVFFLSIIVFVFGSTFTSELLAQNNEEAPSIPTHYKSWFGLRKAIKQGELKFIDRKLPVPEQVVMTKNIVYGKGNETDLKLDLYQPKKVNSKLKRPAILLVHGGSWRRGKKEDLHYYGVKLAEKGYIVVSASYRLSGEAPFPAAIQDLKCAVRWLRANATKYAIDTEKIGVIGASAGAHLSLMLAYTPNISEYEGEGGNPGFSSQVSLVVSLYGPTDFTTPIFRSSSAVTAFMGKKRYNKAKEVYELASPVLLVKKDSPPTLLLHGTIDWIVSVKHSDKLAEKLEEHSVSYTYDRLKGWPHGMDFFEVVNKRCLWSIERFFKEHQFL